MKTIPAMLYDGDCDFCLRWIKKWKGITGDQISYLPYQKVLADYPEVTEEECRKAVRLILPDGTVFSGAHAVFKALALAGKGRWLLWSYGHFPLLAPLSEWFYGLVARHRVFFSHFL